jgi:hypothetical protein
VQRARVKEVPLDVRAPWPIVGHFGKGLLCGVRVSDLLLRQSWSKDVDANTAFSYRVSCECRNLGGGGVRTLGFRSLLMTEVRYLIYMYIEVCVRAAFPVSCGIDGSTSTITTKRIILLSTVSDFWMTR